MRYSLVLAAPLGSDGENILQLDAQAAEYSGSNSNPNECTQVEPKNSLMSDHAGTTGLPAGVLAKQRELDSGHHGDAQGRSNDLSPLASTALGEANHILATSKATEEQKAEFNKVAPTELSKLGKQGTVEEVKEAVVKCLEALKLPVQAQQLSLKVDVAVKLAYMPQQARRTYRALETEYRKKHDKPEEGINFINVALPVFEKLQGHSREDALGAAKKALEICDNDEKESEEIMKHVEKAVDEGNGSGVDSSGVFESPMSPISVESSGASNHNGQETPELPSTVQGTKSKNHAGDFLDDLSPEAKEKLVAAKKLLLHLEYSAQVVDKFAETAYKRLHEIGSSATAQVARDTIKKFMEEDGLVLGAKEFSHEKPEPSDGLPSDTNDHVDTRDNDCVQKSSLECDKCGDKEDCNAKATIIFKKCRNEKTSATGITPLSSVVKAQSKTAPQYAPGFVDSYRGLTRPVIKKGAR